MNIAVCVKQVPDPETPPTGFKVDPTTKRVIPPLGTAPVINPFDENAVEAALRLKDAYGGKVTALTMGPPEAEDVLRHAMAMGADEGILLECSDYDGFNSLDIARCLALAIKKIGDADLVLCGREAADWNSGQVGLGIAELLNLPSVSLVKHIELTKDGLMVERVVANGFDVLKVPLPALLTITNELGNPRYPTVKGITAATGKAITVLTLHDVGADAPSEARSDRLKLIELSLPVRDKKCNIFNGTLEEAAAALTKKIIELTPG